MSERWIDSLETIDDARVAIVDNHEQLTYGELRTQARRHATALCDRYGAGRHVVVRATSSVAFVRTLSGDHVERQHVPIPVDPLLPLHCARATSGRRARRATSSNPWVLLIPTLAEIDRYDPSRPALVVFTSGTSGFPKGVVVSDANLVHSCRTIAEYLDYRAYPSAAVVLPLFYSYALISQVLCQLSIGGRVRLFDDLRNPLKFAATVEDEGLQSFCGVPSTYHALRPVRQPCGRSRCRRCASCARPGAAMDEGLVTTVRDVFPNARFFNNYGMTEASPRIAFIRDDDPRFAEPTCGRPIAGVEVKVIDPETGQATPDGSPGMLVVRGPNVTSGYLNDPEQTARAFTRTGISSPATWPIWTAGTSLFSAATTTCSTAVARRSPRSRSNEP